MSQSQFLVRWGRARRAGVLAACVLAVAVYVTAEPLRAQAPPAPKKPAAKPPAEKLFEEVTLETRDGVFVTATYYPGPEKKTTVPLILVHDLKGNRTEYHSLASFLQQLGHAVIVPDLRGHGTSTRQRGTEAPIDADKLNRRGLESMTWDIEASKSFLLQRNNEGKLNIEQLGILGTGFGATLALKWAVSDWNFVSRTTYKMGQDVKAIMLISPRSFKGVNATAELKNRALGFMSALVVVGTQDAMRYADAKKYVKAFRDAHRDAPADIVTFYEADSANQGMDLIYDRNLQVPDWISGCIKSRLVDQAANLPWVDRTLPLK